MFANLNPLDAVTPSKLMEVTPTKIMNTLENAPSKMMENVVETVVECVECVPTKTVSDVMDAIESIPSKININPMATMNNFTDFLTLDLSQVVFTFVTQVFTSFLSQFEKYINILFIL